MSNTSTTQSDVSPADLQRVSGQITARLQARGVSVHSADTADHLASLLEAVEFFEARVEARGGDLMVDESPTGVPVEPDNPLFVLPARRMAESAAQFIERVRAAAHSL